MPKVPDQASRYRAGARDAAARSGKAAADRARRREQANAAFPPDVRKALLDAVRSGTRLSTAARDVGVTVQGIYGLCARDPIFAQALDAVQRAAAPAGCPHGTPGGYRWYGCRCWACRAAKNGTLPPHAKFGPGRASPRQLRADLDRQAATHGFANWEDMVRRTTDWSNRKLARTVGRSTRTITQWRRRLIDEPVPITSPRALSPRDQSPAWETLREEKARAAGYTSWEQAIRATAGMTGRAAAEQLNVPQAQIYRWRRRLEDEK
jgi:hypothetical protein